MNKKILVIIGHPNPKSFCHALAAAYSEGAQASGHTIKTLALNELQFDPILQHGYHQEQRLEPDLQHAQEALNWATHMVFIYPIWWGSIPACLLYTSPSPRDLSTSRMPSSA